MVSEGGTNTAGGVVAYFSTHFLKSTTSKRSRGWTPQLPTLRPAELSGHSIFAWSITVFDATFLVHKQTQRQTLSSPNPFWEKNTFWARAEHAVKKHAIPVQMIWTLSNIECDVHNSFLWPARGRVGVCGHRPCPVCLHWATVQIYPSGNLPNPKVANHENESLRSFKKKPSSISIYSTLFL